MTSQDPTTYGVSLDEYCRVLAREGAVVIRSRDNETFWRRGEKGSVERHPIFHVDQPPPGEIRRIFWRYWPAVVTYIRLPDAAHPANAWLYVCEDKAYQLETLATQARRNIRRALRRFRFEYLDGDTLREKGEHIYCETRTRVGLSDGTPAKFRGLCESLGKNPAYRLLGAWEGDQLAAFMTALVVEDWIAFSVYSANQHLNSCPNEGLIYHMMRQFLVEGRGRVISYGLSTIQDADNIATLDYFKKKVGFEARPVHRAFEFHPLLRPLVNPLTYWVLQRLTRIWPRNRRLRKGAGLLAASLGRHRPLLEPNSSPVETDQVPSSETPSTHGHNGSEDG